MPHYQRILCHQGHWHSLYTSNNWWTAGSLGLWKHSKWTQIIYSTDWSMKSGLQSLCRLLGALLFRENCKCVCISIVQGCSNVVVALFQMLCCSFALCASTDFRSKGFSWGACKARPLDARFSFCICRVVITKIGGWGMWLVVMLVAAQRA